MDIKLTKVKQSPLLSQETPAFSATVVINGTPRGNVRNDGRGGCCFWQDQTVEHEIEAHAKTLPMVEFDGMRFHESAETLIFGLLP